MCTRRECPASHDNKSNAMSGFGGLCSCELSGSRVMTCSRRIPYRLRIAQAPDCSSSSTPSNKWPDVTRSCFSEYRSWADFFRTRLADSVRGMSTDVGRGSAGGWPKSSDLIAARSLLGGNSGSRYMFSRMSPSKMCSVLIASHPVFEASRRANKITRRARSVKCSNIFFRNPLQAGHARQSPALIAGDKVTIFYSELYACAVAANVARKHTKSF